MLIFIQYNEGLPNLNKESTFLENIAYVGKVEDNVRGTTGGKVNIIGFILVWCSCEHALFSAVNL